MLFVKCFEKVEKKMTDRDGNHLFRVTHSCLIIERHVLAPSKGCCFLRCKNGLIRKEGGLCEGFMLSETTIFLKMKKQKLREVKQLTQLMNDTARR